VALAFIGEPPFEGATVNHLDGDKWNNDPCNLEYLTSADNLRHSHEVLQISRVGEMNGRAKLRTTDIVAIRKMYEQGPYSQSELAAMFGVNQPTISAIVVGRLWRHVA
jgi:predicted XRE-type DNA-binding protein